jgi:hypothetical protein
MRDQVVDIVPTLYADCGARELSLHERFYVLVSEAYWASSKRGRGRKQA